MVFVPGNAAQKKLGVSDPRGSCLAFEVPVRDAVVRMLKAPKFLLIKLVF